MRDSLLEYLRSPVDRSALDMEVLETGTLGSGGEQIISGRLFSRTGDEFPIVQGVPRMLTGQLLQNTMKRYPHFIRAFSDKFKSLGKNAAGNDDQLSTQDSFGDQWNRFHKIYDAYRAGFIEYLSPLLTPADMTNKRVLDAGCGFGRHVYFTAEAGAKAVVGVDLSHAVDAAAINVSQFPNAHIVQGDIYNLPVVESFDLAYSIGVLQHLPDPTRGFVSVAHHVRPSGTMFAWIYGTRPSSYHLVVDNLRKLTVGLSPKTMNALSFALAVVSFGTLALPRRMLSAMGLSSVGEKIPFSRYAEYPFAVSHADWYDRLAAPKTAYLTKEDALSMLSQASLSEQKIIPRAGGSWKILGVR